MAREEIIKLIEQDILDLKGLIQHAKYCIADDLCKRQAKAISLNILEHLHQFYNL